MNSYFMLSERMTVQRKLISATT